LTQLADVQRFIDESRRVKTAAELEGLLAGVTREMGFEYYALIHHVDLSRYSSALDHMDQGNLVALSNYPPAWIEAYITRNIVANDPVLLASHRTSVGFKWEDVPKLIKITGKHRQITEDTRRAGIADGFTVPAHVPGEANGSCNFAMGLGRPLPEQNLAMAHMIGAYAFQAARSLVLNAKDMTNYMPRVPLSQRQLECTFLVGRGKTDWEIAKILGISEETVKRHLKDAREHYDVPKRVQLVIRAVFDGQIALSDLLSH
jgi:LuxR family quorum-sensing system transcriptional regulator CciR